MTKPTLYPKAQAETLAETLQAGELDGWTYQAVPSPTVDMYAIAVTDDRGEFVSFFNNLPIERPHVQPEDKA